MMHDQKESDSHVLNKESKVFGVLGGLILVSSSQARGGTHDPGSPARTRAPLFARPRTRARWHLFRYTGSLRSEASSPVLGPNASVAEETPAMGLPRPRQTGSVQRSFWS